MAERRRTPRPTEDVDPSSVDIIGSPLCFDKEAETTLLGTVLVHPERAFEIVGSVTSEDFHSYVSREVFASMSDLVERGESPDIGAVLRELFARGVKDVNASEVSSLADGVPRGTNWALYAQRVREGAIRRRLARDFASYIRRATTDPIDDIRRDAYALLDAADAGHRPASADRWEVVASELAERYDSGVDERIPSGLAGADLKFGGIPRGSFGIIGARTSIGKTALATTLAWEHASAGRRVSFVSREMDRFWIGHRLVGAGTGLSVRSATARTLNDEEFAAFCGALQKQLPLCIDDKVRTWTQARARIRQHARELGGIDVVYLDYLQLIDPEPRPGEKRYEALGRMSVAVKDLARDLNCVIWGLAQLNRGADDPKREEPRVSDLRESGNLEQDADVIWLIWRNPKDRAPFGGLVPIRLRVAKFRNSGTGEISVYFRKEATRFEEYDEEGE